MLQGQPLSDLQNKGLPTVVLGGGGPCPWNLVLFNSLPGGLHIQLGPPWPSYWAAVDSFGSLILPGNDGGGALRAAMGPPPDPSPQGL